MITNPDSDELASKEIGGVASVLDYERLLRVGLVDRETIRMAAVKLWEAEISRRILVEAGYGNEETSLLKAVGYAVGRGDDA